MRFACHVWEGDCVKLLPDDTVLDCHWWLGLADTLARTGANAGFEAGKVTVKGLLGAA